jgi:hypothetical protein
MRFVRDSVAAHIAEADKGQSLNCMPSEVYENLFQLLTMFWTDTSLNGKMEYNTLVHFPGVLGACHYTMQTVK